MKKLNKFPVTTEHFTYYVEIEKEMYFIPFYKVSIYAKTKRKKFSFYKLFSSHYYTRLDSREYNINTEEIFSLSGGRFKTNREHPDYQRWLEADKQAHIDRVNDKKKLFELLDEYVESWWD